MRIGVIADLHGNLVALDAVLVVLDRAGADQIVCLGDLAVLGPQPADVIERIRERQIATVCGNTDAWLVADHPIPVLPPDSRESIDLTEWTRSQLSRDHLDYVRRLPLALTVATGGDLALRCFHATPHHLDDITHAGFPIPVGESAPSALMCCGHTHIQGLWQVDQQRWVNPGSVGLAGVGPGTPGLPQNRDVCWSEFAVLDVEEGRTAISLHRIEVDLDKLWQSLRASDMPHQAWWRALWR